MKEEEKGGGGYTLKYNPEKVKHEGGGEGGRGVHVLKYSRLTL